ncbi:MAG: hypothetical protein GY795_21215 [Desulfobacterales bacterium]|nr:hypothetical protein [Desulfobacterales bacterium]
MKNSTDKSINNINLLLVAAFFLIITFPSVIWVIVDDKKISATEKRKLNQFPEFPRTTDAFKKYPNKFDSYFMDQFGFRDKLFYLHDLIFVKLEISPSSHVLFGKNGWLFYTSDRVIQDYQNVELFSPEELEKFKACLEAKYYCLKNKNIEYVLVIAPNKHTIYPEHLPSGIKKAGDKSRTDQITEYMQDSEVPVIDLRPALLEAKKKYRVYHKTDTHWNFLGVNTAQYEIAKFLNKIWPETEPYSADDREIQWKEGKGGDLVNLLGVADNLKESRPEIIDGNSFNKKTDEKKYSKNLLIYGDSFSNDLVPLLSNYFNNTTSFLARPSYSFLKKQVKPETTDIVIEEYVERHLRKFLTHCN